MTIRALPVVEVQDPGTGAAGARHNQEVCRPLLPAAAAVADYLKTADRQRWYSNRGRLVVSLEERLSRLFGADQDVVLVTASGTAALEAAILATAGQARPERPYALLPSYTFAATALAAERCGYTPYFLDVDPGSWSLDPESVARHPALAQAGVVIAVAPYGRLPAMEALEELHERQGVPVVVDAAAAFEQVLANPRCISKSVPICLSFHATKTFSTGEGGAVLWRDQSGRGRIAQAINFGLLYSRECRSAGFNGKMSEYAAAVGLAMLDLLEERQEAYSAVSEAYRRAFAASPARTLGRLFVSPEISSAYCLLLARDTAVAAALRAELRAGPFGWRQWYEQGLHAMAHFAERPGDEMVVTGDLGERLIGLPMAPDLSADRIEQIVRLLAGACEGDSLLTTANT